MRFTRPYQTAGVLGIITLLLIFSIIPPAFGGDSEAVQQGDLVDVITTPRDDASMLAVTANDIRPIRTVDVCADFAVDPPQMQVVPHVRTGQERLHSIIPSHRFLSSHHASSGL